MKSWIRIAIVVLVLIGGTASFSYWSVNQFENAFDTLSDSYVANVSSVYLSFKQDAESASTSPEIAGALATSTDPEVSFVFPIKSDKAYIGCTYSISWQSSTTVNSLETALIDAGTSEAVGEKTGGLAKEHTIEKDSQNLNWKVGSVSPGAYYIKISKMNGVEAEFKSKAFVISETSKGTTVSEQKNLCKESGGSS